MPGANLAGARGVAERLVAILEQIGPVTVSAGIAVDGGTGQLDGLMADASAILERARIAGGGRVGAPGRQPTRRAVARRDRRPGARAGRARPRHRRARRAGRRPRRRGRPPPEPRRRGGRAHRRRRAAARHRQGRDPGLDPLQARPAQRRGVGGHARATRVVGERILRAVPGLGPVARMVRHGHESFDGTGYPDGLRGDDIPLGSRIVLACDAYDAMTSDAPLPRRAVPRGRGRRAAGRRPARSSTRASSTRCSATSRTARPSTTPRAPQRAARLSAAAASRDIPPHTTSITRSTSTRPRDVGVVAPPVGQRLAGARGQLGVHLDRLLVVAVAAAGHERDDRAASPAPAAGRSAAPAPGRPRRGTARATPRGAPRPSRRRRRCPRAGAPPPPAPPPRWRRSAAPAPRRARWISTSCSCAWTRSARR